MDYYILYNGQQIGPMSEHQLLNYGLNPESYVWHPGLPQWVKAYTLPDLMNIIRSNPRPTPPPSPGFSTDSLLNGGASGKSRLAFGLFAILLGVIGLQYFYVGKIAGGIICILLTLVTCGIWEIISLIQGILAICMTQEQFEEKYVLSPSTFPLF